VSTLGVFRNALAPTLVKGLEAIEKERGKLAALKDKLATLNQRLAEL